MADSSKIRVGIVGLSPQRGFASIAHIPALHALSDFEIAAVCTTRQESAVVAARHFGIPLAFSNAEDLARHPDVDLVTVTVKVPDHYRSVMAAMSNVIRSRRRRGGPSRRRGGRGIRRWRGCRS